MPGACLEREPMPGLRDPLEKRLGYAVSTALTPAHWLSHFSLIIAAQAKHEAIRTSSHVGLRGSRTYGWPTRATAPAVTRSPSSCPTRMGPRSFSTQATPWRGPGRQRRLAAVSLSTRARRPQDHTTHPLQQILAATKGTLPRLDGIAGHLEQALLHSGEQASKSHGLQFG